MGDFIFGAVDPLPVSPTFDGWDRPNNATLIAILDDGTGGLGELMQQGPIPLRQAQLHGKTRSKATIDLLKGYYETREIVPLLDCDATEITISSSDGNAPNLVVTATNHGLLDGDYVYISGHTSTINGFHLIVRVNASSFTIADQGGGAGTGGVMQRADPARVLELTTSRGAFGDREYQMTLVDAAV